MFDFQKRVIIWYERNKRELPWRTSDDPYQIWVSEIILQQTRVTQGLTYYLKFISRFPDIFTLAAAKPEKILLVWQGLGYYNRALNMKKTAEKLVADQSGVFPSSYSGLLKLKGIGPYTAAAIASIAFKEPVPVVDGNVSRVLSRIFGIQSQKKNKFEKVILNKANQLLDRKNPGIYNQAVMEFGALQCTPTSPDCNKCIFHTKCFAFQKGKIDKFPPKKQKPVQKERFFYFFFLERGDHFFIHQRPAGDIWAGLYELPLVETPKESDPGKLNTFQKKTSWHKLLQKSIHLHPEIVLRHKLTHQTIIAQFYHLKLDEKKKDIPPDFLAIRKEDYPKYAFPKLIVNYLENKL